MLNHTRLLHGYSFNSWSDVITYDEQFVEEWLDSPQTSLYYSLQVMSDTQDKADAYVRHLSGGMKRRLMIAKAMVHSPQVLILDEPTAGVDVSLRELLWQNIKDLNKKETNVKKVLLYQKHQLSINF